MCIHPLTAIALKNLKPIIGKTSYHFLLACSGGADSTALFEVFRILQSILCYRLSVITVNHNIRSSEESIADIRFVEELCRKADPPIRCIIETIPAGAVAHFAQERKRGIEDAARALRYQLFEKTADSIGADFIVTAHNQNDMYETVLMRLFQGAGTASLSLMPVRRGRYIRPLIAAPRSLIEDFLRQQSIPWQEDATNAADTYLRNRIRHYLVPALQKTFGGWHGGLDKTLQRIGFDCLCCDQLLTSSSASVDASMWVLRKHGALAMNAAYFDSLPSALRLRLLEDGCRRLQVRERVPLGALLRLSGIPSEQSGVFASAEDCTVNHITVDAAGALRLERRGKDILLFNSAAYLKYYEQRAYTLTIAQCGKYAYPFGVLQVYGTSASVFVKDSEDMSGGVGPFALPIFIRSRCRGDRIQMASGKLKQVKKIFNEWHVDSLARVLLPIIVEGRSVPKRIRALYGSVLGYKNWFVEE